MPQAKMLDGKVAVITGGARGIGLAIAHRYADEGVRAVIADLNEDGAKDAAAEIDRGAVSLHLNVTRQESIDAMTAAVAAQCGRLDILVKNTGIFDLAPIAEIVSRQHRSETLSKLKL